MNSRKRVAMATPLGSEHPTEEPSQPVARPSKTKQQLIKAAQLKLGALVRACHALGVYSKVRSSLSVIEAEIKE